MKFKKLKKEKRSRIYRDRVIKRRRRHGWGDVRAHGKVWVWVDFRFR